MKTKKTKMVQLWQLQPGDRFAQIDLTVKSIDHFGSLVIIDLTDNTAFAPKPCTQSVEIFCR